MALVVHRLLQAQRQRLYQNMSFGVFTLCPRMASRVFCLIVSTPPPLLPILPWRFSFRLGQYGVSHVNDHILAGMQAFYTVHDKDNPDDDFSFFFGYSDDGTTTGSDLSAQEVEAENSADAQVGHR